MIKFCPEFKLRANSLSPLKWTGNFTEFYARGVLLLAESSESYPVHFCLSILSVRAVLGGKCSVFDSPSDSEVDSVEVFVFYSYPMCHKADLLEYRFLALI